MKVAILSFFNGHIERGLENWTYELSSRLSKKYEVVVFQNGIKKTDQSFKIISTKIPVNWTKSNPSFTPKRRLFLDYWSLLIASFTIKVWPILWKENFDIIIPTNGGWQSFLVRVLSLLKGSKMVIVGHSGRGWDDRFNSWCFPNTFITLTQSATRWVKKTNPFIKVVHIPNGVNLNRFNPQGEKLLVKLKKPIILCASALVPSKRIDLVVRAVGKLDHYNLLVVGGGELEEELDNLGKKLFGDRFLLTKLPYHQMPKVYRSADIFALTSWHSEAFPLVYLEALASNLPVVATDDEVRREIVGDAGILVNPENTDSLAQAISKALTTKWNGKPRKQAEKFNWDKIVKEYEKVFNEVVGQK